MHTLQYCLKIIRYEIDITKSTSSITEKSEAKNIFISHEMRKMTVHYNFIWFKNQALVEKQDHVRAVIHQGRPRPLLALLWPLNPRPLPSPLPLAVPEPDPEVDRYAVCPPPPPPRL